MDTEQQVTDNGGKIEVIAGNKRVLLVAPHGFMRNETRNLDGDEPSAARLAREMARNFGFYAVINEKYKRTKKHEAPDKSKGMIDCGRINQIDLIADEFLAPILNFKEKILTEHGNPLVVFIHGLGDRHRSEYIKTHKADDQFAILIGYGQGNGQGSRTASPELIEGFKKALVEEANPGILAVEAHTGSDYCGADLNNLSQLFRLNQYHDGRVQCLQLEIRNSLRMPEAIEATAQALGAALLKLAQNNMPAPVESAPDLMLVDSAHRKLVGIFTGHFESAMKEAGRYLIDQFYGSDIQRARDNKPVRGQSLYQLITRLSQQDNGPRKSWIYNSVAMAIQDNDFSGFHTYGKIGLSHKVALLRVHDRAQKEKLIEETAREALPVVRLREKIAELKDTKRHPAATSSLAKTIDRPEVLFHGEGRADIQVEALKELDDKALDHLLARAQKRKSELESNVLVMKEHARNYARFIKKIDAAKKQRSKELDKHVTLPMKGAATWLDPVPRIISVSRKTDIPAYYGGWFMECLRKGFAGYINSIVKSEKYLVSLKPEHVICFVFWSKNFAPFVESLKEVRERGYGCLLHFTITGLPKEFEPNVPDPEMSINTIKELSRIFSPDNVFWRYDPIVISDATDENYHLKRFEWISSQLEGSVSRCYFSFPTHYKKVSRSIKKFKDDRGIAIYDPGRDFKVSLANRLAEFAGQHGMTMHSCAGEYLVGGKIEKAHCVDGDLIDNLFSLSQITRRRKEKPMREGCGCAKSTDIGVYDSCANGCIYCYANMNKDKAILSHRQHDPVSAFLGYPKKESDSWIKEAEKQESQTEGDIKNPEMGDKSWNVVTGCDKYSDGCLNCYAEDTTQWLAGMGQAHYQQHGFSVTMVEEKLDWPLRLAKESKIPVRSFVTQMGDLFHAKVSDEFIYQVFETMLKVPQHRFYVLTKRADRLGELGPKLPWRPWIWAGVTVESNKYLHRIEHLKELPPEVHKFLMLEPLLSEMPELDLKGIEWVIVGGETNKKNKFRLMKEEWVTGIRDQVKKAGLPFMFKHWPGKTHNSKEALLEGKIWNEFPESILSNLPGGKNSKKTGTPAPKRIGRHLLTSALQKTIRWCEVNDARYFAQKFIEMGWPGAVFNRLMVIAVEDVGLADPTLAKYVRDCFDTFESTLIEHKTKKKEVANSPETLAVIDRAVIAAALAHKSRLLPMLLFASLWDIYRKEDFSHGLDEYASRFRRAIQNRDEKEAAYYACILAIILDSENSVLEIAEQESKTRATRSLIDEWTLIYEKTKEKRLTLIGIVSLLCRDLNYSHGEYRDQVSKWLSSPMKEATVPDRAYDMHTLAKRTKGRGLEHFFNEAASVKNERFPNDWKESGEKAYYQAREEGLERAAKVIEAIEEKVKKIREEKPANALRLNLPFEYRKAVLTQARTSKSRPFAFIVEFGDGSRKFVKGPFQNEDAAEDHLRYNEVKRRLESKYLHPIHCELMRTGTGIFLICDEIGRADLNQVEKKETMLDGKFEVLSYESTDVVPDPLKYLEEINRENQHLWMGMMVNYCFRWVFGLGDAAGRNLMLERSTGKIYSTDEIFLRSSTHEDIWGGRRPAKEKLELIRAFAESGLLNDVLIEVRRWKTPLGTIRREIAHISEEVEKRIDHFLESPEKVLGLIPSRGNKHAFTYEGKTGIAETKGFNKKGLADFACNIGNICELGCTFCYVPAVTTKQKYVQEVLNKGYSIDQVSIYRTRENLLECVERDIKKIGRDDKRVVFFCTTCDPCATKEHADITTEAIRLIMTRSDLQVRVLSKSVLILEIAKALDLYRDRIIYSLSTGTVRPQISACIEGNASPIEERLRVLHILGSGGYRTYGMLCPILPSEMPHLGKLIDAVNPKSCEHVWAEAINLRGKSLVKTRDKLKDCDLKDDAESIQKVVGNKDRWRDYCKELFLKVREELEERGFGDKLRFLQYVVGEPEDFRRFFESQKGAVCL